MQKINSKFFRVKLKQLIHYFIKLEINLSNTLELKE